MDLLSYLTVSDFYAFAGLTRIDVNESFLTTVIDRVNKLIDQRLSGLFTIPEESTIQDFSRNISLHIVAVGTWQADELAVKYGTDGGSLVTLTENIDYRFIYAPNKTDVVIGVKLFGFVMNPHAYIRLDGFTGYSNEIPAEIMLDIQLYDLIKTAVIINDSDRLISSTSIGKTNVSYADDPKMAHSLKDVLAEVLHLVESTEQRYAFDAGYFPTIIG